MGGAPASKFPTTAWSLVIAAAQPTASSRAALATLCNTYWPPIYAFIRRSGHDRDQAEDLTQAFFTVLLEKNYLGDADRERGRFRNFLLTAIKHFLANQRDRAHALKRGGGQAAVPIDLVQAEAWYTPEVVEPRTPERLFEHRWALSLLERVMAGLREEYTRMGKATYFDKLATFLNDDPESDSYSALSAELGVSPGALRVAVHRMRRRYRDLLRWQISQTVATPEEIDGEIRFLLSALRI